MSTDVMLVVLLGAMLHAGWNALVHGAGDKLLDTAIMLSGAALWALLALIQTGLPEAACLPWLIASVAIHVLYFLLVAMSYRGGELSVIYPVMRGGAPLLTTLAAMLLLAEAPSAVGTLGVLTLAGGVLLLAGAAWRSGGDHRHALSVALLNAAVIALYTVVDGKGVRLSGDAFSYNALMFLFTALGMLLIVLKLRGAQALLSHGRRYCLRGLGAGACTIASYGLALWAMTRAPVALVAALRESSVIFAMLLGAWFAAERLRPIKLVSIGLVLCGMVAIRLA